MRKIFTGLCLLSFCSFVHAQNGLENVIVEKYYISNAADSIGSIGILPVGSTTYRIYADMLPGYKFQAAYGVAGHELRLATTTTFFNNEDYGSTTPAFSKTNAAKNTVMLDSWFSVGAACNSNFGILKTEDDGVNNVVNVNGILQNNDPAAGIPLTAQDGLIAGTPEQSVTFVGIQNTGNGDLGVFDATSQVGGLFSTFNGSVASLNGSTGFNPAVNKVLIAQVTTKGCLSFELNLQIGTPGGGVQNYVARNPVGNEIHIPGLLYNTPGVAITANPAGPVCTGTSVTFTATPSNGGGSPVYQWKKNGANVGTNSPTYTTSGLANNNQITCVMTSNAAGLCVSPTATSNAIVAQVNALPAATITPNGPTTFCKGTTPLTLNANTGAGLFYQWKKGSNNLAGQTFDSYVPTATGTYKVVVTNFNGCSKTSPGVAVTANPKPAATITPQGPTTFCLGDSVQLLANSGAGYIYQWKKGSSNVSGATAISYYAKTTGSYKVKVTNSFGCSKTSSAVSVTANNCRFEETPVSDQGSEFVIYPNPAQNEFTLSVSFENIEYGDALIEIIDVLGKIVYSSESEVYEGELNAQLIADLKPAVYYVKVSVNGESLEKKLLVQ